jgi:hypothetical protein
MDDNKPKLVIAPGAFDNFDGTQEELQEFIAMLRTMVEDGSIFEQSEPVPDDEAQEIMQKLASKPPRQ